MVDEFKIGDEIAIGLLIQKYLENNRNFYEFH